MGPRLYYSRVAIDWKALTCRLLSRSVEGLLMEFETQDHNQITTPQHGNASWYNSTYGPCTMSASIQQMYVCKVHMSTHVSVCVYGLCGFVNLTTRSCSCVNYNVLCLYVYHDCSEFASSRQNTSEKHTLSILLHECLRTFETLASLPQAFPTSSLQAKIRCRRIPGNEAIVMRVVCKYQKVVL